MFNLTQRSAKLPEQVMTAHARSTCRVAHVRHNTCVVPMRGDNVFIALRHGRQDGLIIMLWSVTALRLL